MGTVIDRGEARVRFEVCEGWGELPDGWRFVEVAGVATDSRDRVFVFNRGEHPVIVFDRDGRFLGSWGEGCSSGRTASRSAPTTPSIAPTTSTTP